MIEIKNYGSANIMQMGTINIGLAPMFIVKCKLSYIKKKQKNKAALLHLQERETRASCAGFFMLNSGRLASSKTFSIFRQNTVFA